MSCTCINCLRKRGLVIVTGTRPAGNGSGGVRGPDQSGSSLLQRADELPAGLNKEQRLAEERAEDSDEAITDSEIRPLNPRFPYRVIQPDFSYFGVPG